MVVERLGVDVLLVGLWKSRMMFCCCTIPVGSSNVVRYGGGVGNGEVIMGLAVSSIVETACTTGSEGSGLASMGIGGRGESINFGVGNGLLSSTSGEACHFVNMLDELAMRDKWVLGNASWGGLSLATGAGGGGEDDPSTVCSRLLDEDSVGFEDINSCTCALSAWVTWWKPYGFEM